MARSPEVTRGHPRSPEITRGHTRSPEITRGHPRSPEVTRDHTFRDEDEGCDTRRGKRVGRECGPRLFTPPPLNQVRDAARQPSHRLHAKELQRALCRVQHCHQRLGRRRVRRRRHGVRSSVLAGVCVRLLSCVCRHNGVDAVRLLRRAASRGLRGLLLVRPVRPLRLPKGGGELGTARPSLTLP